MVALATTRAITVAVGLGVAASPALAAPEPTLTDIAGCNEQAAARTGGSALPHPGSRTPEMPHRDPSISPRPDATRPSPGPGTPLPGTGGPRMKTDPSGSIVTQTPDPLLKGMDAAKVDDPQYRAAYRDCMRARLETR